MMALVPTSYSYVARSQFVALVATTSEVTPRLEVRQSAGRGSGLFTLDHIPAFSRILEDDALLSMAHGEDLPHLWDRYLALPSRDREAFDALSPPAHQVDKEARIISKLRLRGCTGRQAEDMARVSSKFQGNAFRAGVNAGDWTHGHLLFPKVARINHSCTPNAHSHYRASTGAQYIYAVKDLKPGEEIEIAYFDHTAPWAERQNRAKGWSFTCKCPACSREFRRDYESRLAIVSRISADRSGTSGPGRLESIRQGISIAESEDTPWLRIDLPHLYTALAAALPEDAALDAAHTAASWQDRITGPDSPQAYFLKIGQSTGDSL